MKRIRLKESAEIIQFPKKKIVRRKESDEADNGDHFEKWHKEMVSPHHSRAVSHTSAYTHYLDHADEHGVEGMDFKKFHSMMNDKGYVSKKHIGRPSYVGITVKPNPGDIDEEVHPRIQGVLDKVPAPKMIHAIRQVAANIRAKGEDPGVKGTMFPPKGSSRAVIHATKPVRVNLDGKAAHVPVTVKIGFRGETDSKQDKKLTGQLQNHVEASPKIKPFHMMRKEGRKFVTNPDGVIPTVHSKGKEGRHIVIDRVKPVGDEEGDKLFRQATKHESTPNGLSPEQFVSALHGYNKTHENHPVVKKFMKFSKATGVRDFHPGNIGVWTHPHTGEHHAVLLDAGFDDTSKKRYDRYVNRNTTGGFATRNRKYQGKINFKKEIKVRRKDQARPGKGDIYRYRLQLKKEQNQPKDPKKPGLSTVRHAVQQIAQNAGAENK